jgi:hypothetical protein
VRKALFLMTFTADGYDVAELIRGRIAQRPTSGM